MLHSPNKSPSFLAVTLAAKVKQMDSTPKQPNGGIINLTPEQMKKIQKIVNNNLDGAKLQGNKAVTKNTKQKKPNLLEQVAAMTKSQSAHHISYVVKETKELQKSKSLNYKSNSFDDGPLLATKSEDFTDITPSSSEDYRNHGNYW